jgi:hypothetical protein
LQRSQSKNHELRPAQAGLFFEECGATVPLDWFFRRLVSYSLVLVEVWVQVVDVLASPTFTSRTNRGFGNYGGDGLTWIMANEDFIESKVNLGVDPATGVTLFQSQNVARARIEGAELAATLNLGELNDAFHGWSGRVAASWVQGDARATADVSRPAARRAIDALVAYYTRPGFNASATLRYDF